MTYPHGLMSWTDISLPDPKTGKAFYTALFGWEAEDQFDPDGNYIYTMFRQDGVDVAGMGPMPPGTQDAGVPPMWQTYISVDDVAEAVATVTENGGSVVVPAMEVMTSGKMAIVADPEGAVASLWEAGDHLGAGAFNGNGQLSWNELNTRDSAAARRFWGNVMGWTFSEFEGSPAEYWMMEIDKTGVPNVADDKYTGGILTMDENFPDYLPAHWMVYFQVDDTDAAAAKIVELGGSVPVPPFDSAAGRMAVVNDDQGGTFMIISYSTAAE